MSGHYYFLPSSRGGLAASIDGPADIAQRVGISVTITPSARSKASGATTELSPITQTIQLYGPGDIVGFDSRAVERTDPKPDVGDFEWNYFPAIEFVDADFAWRFTADVANEQGTLAPWITLIVLVAETQGTEVMPEFTALPSSGRAPGQITIPDRSVLPDLANAWRWAHVHIDATPGLTRDGLLALLRDEPERATCRLLCPRRLRAGTRYAAFVVPTFKLGLLAGLGHPLDSTVKPTTFAWSSADASVTIPYYYRWEFRTSAAGDFEQLVRRLEPRPLPNLGFRDVDCSTPGFGVTGVSRVGNSLGLEGALRSIGTSFTPWGRDPATAPAGPVPPTQQELADLINLPDSSLITSDIGFAVTAAGDVTNASGRGLPSATAVELSWRTAVASTSEAQTTAPDGTVRSVSAGTLTFEHLLAVTGLVPGQNYRFALGGRNAARTALAPAVGTLSLPVPSVVPPIYGRWHYGRDVSVRPDSQEPWFHVLNLDPRHRLAAGFGAEVVRQQQESLMASAWDQLGAADDANGLLRRAQFGRQNATRLFERLGQLPPEDLVYVTRRAQERILVTDSATGQRTTVARSVSASSRIPAAVLDPAFRRIARRRGPIRTRQGRPRSTNLLTRLAAGGLEPAGPPPVPIGTTRLCDISTGLRDALVPSVSLTATPATIADGGTVTLKWSSTNGTSRVASGMWSGTKASSGTQVVGPFTRPVTGGGGTGGGAVVPPIVPSNPLDPNPVPLVMTLPFQLQCDGPGGTVLTSVIVMFQSGGASTGGSVSAAGRLVRPATWDASSKRFCDGDLDPQQVSTSLASNPFNIAIATGYTVGPSVTRVLGALQALDREPPADGRPPRRNALFVADTRNAILQALDPAKTVLARTRARLKLSGSLARRFDSGAPGDPLDSLFFEPTFPQPMYEPLRDIAHQLLLPGVEKIPQETVSILETNRRFIESYMCGLNHEFAGELLWREYPTDQRGSYFRQFWDVSEYVSSDAERSKLPGEWSGTRGLTIPGLTHDAKVKLLRRELLGVTESCLREFDASQQAILKRLADNPNETLNDVADNVLNAIVQAAATQDQLNEKLRDVARLADWKVNRLGSNRPAAAVGVADPLVFVLRGELLRRYPGALVYAVDAVTGPTGHRRPGLEEYLRDFVGEISAGLQPALEIRPIAPALISPLAAIGIDIRIIRRPTVSTVVPGAQWVIAMAGARYDVLKASNALRVYRSVAPRRTNFPIFKASLPPDIAFYGFPFTADEARTGNNGLGKYFIIEERVGEPRFGLDVPGPETMGTWDDLSWNHFGLHTDDGLGKYLDNAPAADPTPPPADNEGRSWQGDNTSSATRAWITLQKPARVAVHAKQMLP